MVRVCSIPECDRPHVARGYCRSHYSRWEKTGDVKADVPIKTESKCFAFLKGLRGSEERDCIFWPFGCAKNGYAMISYQGRNTTASRICCEIYHGQPPTPQHQAAHSCGNGHLGCVNPNHLRWATPKENTKEKYDHGTILYGERSPVAKLSDEQVAEIRHRHGAESAKDLAKEFGVCRGHIFDLVSGKYRYQPDCDSIKMERIDV